jgi:hypothetical protein
MRVDACILRAFPFLLFPAARVLGRFCGYPRGFGYCPAPKLNAERVA